MLTFICVVSVLNFLLGFYNLFVSNNGFTVLMRRIIASESKSTVLVKKCDEVISRYNQVTKGITEELKGQ